MAQPARCVRLTRRSWLLVSLGTGVSAALSTAGSARLLTVRLDGDVLYITAPGWHFLTGKPLERLKDGTTVVFVSQLSLSLDANRSIFRPLPERFEVSYDIWEEKFSVRRRGGATRSVKGLSSDAAEAWCLESLAISTAGIGPNTPVWVRLDMRALDPKDQAGVVGDSGISLRRLTEYFSRPARNEQPHWTLDSDGPIRLGALRRAESRGSRSS